MSKMSDKQPCRICGSAKASRIFDVDNYGIFECGHCGFRFPQLIPSQEKLEQHYDTEYGDDRFRQGQAVNAQINKRIIYKVYGDIYGKSIIDVGAGYGFLANDLSCTPGCVCDAIEISAVQRDYAVENFGLKVFPSFSQVQHKYDLVVSFEVLEHVPDPAHFLSLAASLLKPGGVMIIGTDHFDSPTVKKMGKDFPKWVPREHISCFTPSSIRRLFENEKMLDAFSLQTYISWEMRALSLCARLRGKARILPRRAKLGKSIHAAHMPPPACSVNDLGKRKYRFYLVRRLISPHIAALTLSPTLEGEMMIVKAIRAR